MSFSVPKTGKSRTKDNAPMTKPNIKVAIDACFVPRRQNTPNRNTVVMGGARSAAITLMASNMLEYLLPCVDHNIASSMTTTELIRPISTCIRSVISGRMRLTMSTATSVPELFTAAETALKSAASTAAEISPLRPVGSNWLMRTGQSLVTRGADQILEQHICDDAGEDQQEDRQYFEKARQQRTELRILFGASPEYALHDGLIRTPIPHAQNWVAEKYRIPVQARAAVRLKHAQLVRLHRRLELSQRVDAMLGQRQDCEYRDHTGTEEQKNGVEGFRDYYRPQSAQNGVDGDHDRDDQN